MPSLDKKQEPSLATNGGPHDEPEVLLDLHKTLVELASEAATNTGALESVEEEIEPLLEHGRAMARKTARTPYDPTNIQHDALREEETQKALRDRIEVEKQSKFATATVREEDEALADLTPPGPKPKPNSLISSGSVIVIAASATPSLRDTVLGAVHDTPLALFLAFTIGAALGGLVALGILWAGQNPGRRSGANIGGLIIGFILGIGFFVARIASAEGIGEVLVALFLTAIEFVACLVLEWHARHLRALLDLWTQLSAPHERAVARRDAATRDLARLEALLADLNRKLKAHREYVEDRTLRHLGAAELEQVVVKAIRDGFARGVARNRGRLLGVARRVR